jgi:hypothetical protein
MPYPTVDWGQNLIEGLRTGAYARSLREEALRRRMELALEREQIAQRERQLAGEEEERPTRMEYMRAQIENWRKPESKSEWQIISEMTPEQAKAYGEKSAYTSGRTPEWMDIPSEKGGRWEGTPTDYTIRQLLNMSPEKQEAYFKMLDRLEGKSGESKEDEFRPTFHGDTAETDLVNEVERSVGLRSQDWPESARIMLQAYRMSNANYDRILRQNKEPGRSDMPISFENLVQSVRKEIAKSRSVGREVATLGAPIRWDLPTTGR